MSPVFLEISGSVQSTNEENSQEKTATFSRRTAQVSVLHIVFFFISMSSISFIHLCDVFISDLFESTLWKKGKDNKQFLKRIFLLSRKDFTLRYFIKEDVSTSVAIYFSVQRRFLCFHGSSTNTFLFPSSIHCSKKQVQSSQSCHLHEGPECSFPAREDQSYEWSADLLPARRADEESVCVSREWPGELS